VFLVLCWRDLMRGRTSAETAPRQLSERTLLVRIFIFTAAIIVMGIVLSGATNCRNRWLQPLVIPTPILLVSFWHRYLKGWRLKIVLGLAATVAVGVAIAAPSRILLTEKLGKLEGLNAPFKVLARQLEKPLRPVGQIYCSETAMAGNLRVWFPRKTITTPGVSRLYPPQPGCALVWDPSANRSAAFVAKNAFLTGNSPAEARYVEALQKYHHTRTMRLGVLIPP
jgi:hypothetical protein